MIGTIAYGQYTKYQDNQRMKERALVIEAKSWVYDQWLQKYSLKVSPKIQGQTKGTLDNNPNYDSKLPAIIKDEWEAEMKYFLGLVPQSLFPIVKNMLTKPHALPSEQTKQDIFAALNCYMTKIGTKQEQSKFSDAVMKLNLITNGQKFEDLFSENLEDSQYLFEQITKELKLNDADFCNYFANHQKSYRLSKITNKLRSKTQSAAEFVGYAKTIVEHTADVLNNVDSFKKDVEKANDNMAQKFTASTDLAANLVKGEVKFVADIAKSQDATKLGGSFAIVCLELNKACQLSNKELSEEDSKDPKKVQEFEQAKKTQQLEIAKNLLVEGSDALGVDKVSKAASILYEGQKLYNNVNEKGITVQSLVDGVGILGELASLNPSPQFQIGSSAVGIGKAVANTYIATHPKEIEKIDAKIKETVDEIKQYKAKAMEAAKLQVEQVKGSDFFKKQGAILDQLIDAIPKPPVPESSSSSDDDNDSSKGSGGSSVSGNSSSSSSSDYDRQQTMDDINYGDNIDPWRKQRRSKRRYNR